MVLVELLEVRQSKIDQYLLNIDHAVGRSKAKFFLACGFKRTEPIAMAKALARQAMNGWPGDELPTPDSMKHRITGPVDCPNGDTPTILTVWEIKTGSTTASLVTARPCKPKASSL